ncbi:hypothetical protein IH879_13855 [candidate division KSB1 bacterium]|nr:hypothetical protein [candidate division KSB1 bacterium]
MNKFERKNAQLVTEFDRFIFENPEFADSIPDRALVAMQLEDDEFNRWSRNLAQKQAEKGQKIVFINIKKMRPIQTIIEKLELVLS